MLTFSTDFVTLFLPPLTIKPNQKEFHKFKKSEKPYILYTDIEKGALNTLPDPYTING